MFDQKSYMKKYRAKCKEKYRLYMKNYYESHRKQWKECSKRWRQSPKGQEFYKHYQQLSKTKMAIKKWRQSIRGKEWIKCYFTLGKGKECQKRYSQSLKYRETKRRYYRTTKGNLIFKTDAHNRRLKTKDLTVQIIQQVYENNIKKYGTLTCIYCLRPIIFGKDSLEHKIPLSRGGGNNIENLDISCRHCNSSKNNKTVEEFKLLKKELKKLEVGKKG